MAGLISALEKVGGLMAKGSRGLPRLAEDFGELASPLARRLPSAHPVDRIEPVRVHDPQVFHEAVKAAKLTQPTGAAVELKPVSEYAKTKNFMTPDGLSGFAIKSDGDLVSVFSAESGTGRFRQIMDTAIRNGAKKLDAFDVGLPEMYGKHGFKTYEKLPWDEQYAPQDWPAWLGPRDIHMMDRTSPRAPRMLPGPDDIKARPRRSMPLVPGIAVGAPSAFALSGRRDRRKGAL